MGLSLMPLSKASAALRHNVIERFDIGIWIATVIRLLTSASFSICLPFLALYLHKERGISMTLVGIAFLVAGICSAATQMVGGMLADRLGRRRLLIGATGMGALLYCCLTLFIGISAPVWSIIVAYVAGRSMLRTIRPVVSAVVADLSPHDRLTESFGLLRVGGNVGFAAGPAVGGYLLTVLPYEWLFGVAALIGLIAFCLVLLFFKESFHGSTERVDLRSTLSVATDRRFLAFTGLSLLVFLHMGQLSSTLSVFTIEKLGFLTSQYGLLLTINGLLIVFFQYPIARGTNHLARYRGLLLGSLLYAIGYLTLGWVQSFNWALATILVVTAGEMVFAPLTLSVVAESSSSDWRGRYMGFFGLSQTLGIALGPLVGGILLDAFPTEPLFVWGIISSTGFLAALGFQKWGVARRKI
jgi:MFS family permease